MLHLAWIKCKILAKQDRAHELNPEIKRINHSSVTSVFITQNGLSLPSRDYYIGRNLSSDRDLQLLRDHISRGLTLTMPKATQSSSGFPQQIMERSYAVVRFEAQLAASMLSNVNLRNSEVTYGSYNSKSGK